MWAGMETVYVKSQVSSALPQSGGALMHTNALSFVVLGRIQGFLTLLLLLHQEMWGFSWSSRGSCFHSQEFYVRLGSRQPKPGGFYGFPTCDHVLLLNWGTEMKNALACCSTQAVVFQNCLCTFLRGVFSLWRIPTEDNNLSIFSSSRGGKASATVVKLVFSTWWWPGWAGGGHAFI